MVKYENKALLEAEFDKVSIQKYWLLAGVIISVLTVVGIPLMLIWVPIVLLLSGKLIDRMEAILTPTKLIIRKGLLVRTEKLIPLEKITDVGLVQGPIMRCLGLHQISVETAGQSSGGQALVRLIGVVDTENFRETVLDQRDAVSERRGSSESSAAASEAPSSTLEGLDRINTTLERIEGLLADRSRSGP